MGWIAEHGEEFEVPAEITQIEGIKDLSWHNDVCPRFGTNDEGIGPNLYADHPDPDQREMGPVPRFLVIYQVGDCPSTDDVEVYAGDDVTEAVMAFLTALLKRG